MLHELSPVPLVVELVVDDVPPVFVELVTLVELLEFTELVALVELLASTELVASADRWVLSAGLQAHSPSANTVTRRLIIRSSNASLAELMCCRFYAVDERGLRARRGQPPGTSP
jgi:hypothetical protein